MTLKIKKILISQQQPENGKNPYTELIKNYNVAIDFRSFTEVDGISSKEFRKYKVNILDHTAIILTSKTGVDHFFRICTEMRVTVPETMKYFCISESVAFYLQKYIVYRKRKIFYANNKFDDLVDILMKHKEEKFLLPLSDTHKPEIPKKLTKLKLTYSKAILYRTITSKLNDLITDNYDMLVFFSPSCVKSLFDNYPNFKQENTKIACFGPTTAKAIKDSGLRLDVQAPTTQAPSMSMALDIFIKKFNKENGNGKLQ